ncbi:MAG: GGDEF domain-containing protein [Actinomycetota bacterium]
MPIRGRMEARSWLCPNELDRTRVVEANDRVRRARTLIAIVVGLSLIASAPFNGWWTLILFSVAVLDLGTLDRRLAGAERPERVAARTLLLMLALFSIGAAIDGGVEGEGLPWMVIPAAVAPLRFRGAVVFAFAALTALLAVAVSFGVDPAAAAHNPVPLLVTLALLVSVTGVTWALMDAEIQQREAAVLDPLTGLLNRATLEARVAELEHQAGMTGDSVCFVACDLDGFKRVNDTYGHDRGDAVLKATAYELRKSLRSFELIYRLGGEEFLVVLPGADLEEGTQVAERLRSTVDQARPGGLELTMSVGVGAAAGEAVSYDELFKAADEALYSAKEQGRNRVVASTAPAPEPQVTQPAPVPAG